MELRYEYKYREDKDKGLSDSRKENNLAFIVEHLWIVLEGLT